MADFLSVTEVAAQLRVTRARVLVYINDGRLGARMVGKQYVIRKADLSKIRIRKPGRPQKAKQ